MEDDFIAHYNPDTNEIQSVSAHNYETAVLTQKICPIQELSGLAWLAGILHDGGKYLREFQQYIQKAIEEPGSVKRGSVVHSSLGGLMIEELVPETVLAEMIQMAVFSHHGLNDSFFLETGQVLKEKRIRFDKEDRDAKHRYYDYIGMEELAAKIELEKQSIEIIVDKIKQSIKSAGGKFYYGHPEFYFGMYERVLTSVLIDSDRLNTAVFMQNREMTERRTKKELQMLWGECLNSLEKKLESFRSRQFQNKSKLDDCRSQISEDCKMASYSPGRLFHLTVPTGGGKTLSSLRFALCRAKEQKLEHIIYVVSFNTILEQNASEIKDALQRDDIILEHHCNVIHETKEDENNYHLMTENWDSPILVTSAVQLLNTLFSSATGSVRRMHNLCNSVIIFDEVQALPVRTIKLFNLAVNFLTEFSNSTVVLCSATQPLFDRLPTERMLPVQEMAGVNPKYGKIFDRCRITDMTDEPGGPWGIPELGDFVKKIRREKNQILIIINTKKCAKKLFCMLRKEFAGEAVRLFHLSTNMCPVNRQEILKDLQKTLESKQSVLCISTQIIEAGIDISFQCVIRSLAGLDNIIQAAGRCNRHGEADNGDVYVVRMNEEAENISRLKDIGMAQESMRWLLSQYKRAPGNYDSNLASDLAIDMYYQVYTEKRLKEMEYNQSVKGAVTSLVQMLSANEKLWTELKRSRQTKYPTKYPPKRPAMRQYFKTAGDLFEVIPEDGKIEVVVEYDETAKNQINLLQDPFSTWEQQRMAVRMLKPYTVSISEEQRKKLGSAVSAVYGGLVLVLSENYYSKDTGVSEFPEGMEFLGY